MEADFLSKLDSHILEFYKLVDNISHEDQQHESVLKNVDKLLNRWADDKNPSSFVSLIRANQNVGKKIDRGVVQRLFDDAESVHLDKHIINTFLQCHGSLDLGTFITVPKNTIIITFVNEGRLHLDIFGLQEHFQSKQARMTVLWMKYITKALAYCQAQKVPLTKKAEFYHIIKKFIVGFVEIKNKYLEKFNYDLGSDYALINRDVVAYYENDLIPNQHLFFDDLPIYGIAEWNVYIEGMFGEMGQYVQVLDPNNPFFGIYESLSQASRESKGAAKPKQKKAKNFEREKEFYLLDILYEMEKRLAEKFPDDSETVRPINLVFLGACRSADQISLKPQHSFLFKNLAYHLRNRMQNYVEEPRFQKGYDSTVMNENKSLQDMIKHHKETIGPNFNKLIDNRVKNTIKLVLPKLKPNGTSKDKSKDESKENYNKKSIVIIKNGLNKLLSSEFKRVYVKKIFMDSIRDALLRMDDRYSKHRNVRRIQGIQHAKEKKTKKEKERGIAKLKEKNDKKKKKNKQSENLSKKKKVKSIDGGKKNVRPKEGEFIEQKVLERKKAREELEYDIFYDRICVMASDKNYSVPYLYYYNDARDLHFRFPEQQAKLYPTYDLPDPKSKTKKIKSRWVDFLEKFLPVRDQNGQFLNVLVDYPFSKGNQNGIENSQKKASDPHPDIDLKTTQNMLELESRLFFIPKNVNTSLYFNIYTLYDDLDIKPFLYSFLRNEKLRELIFWNWKRNFSPYVVSNHFTKVYCNVMELTFVKKFTLSDKLVVDEIKTLDKAQQLLFHVFSEKKAFGEPYKIFTFFDFDDYYLTFLDKDFFIKNWIWSAREIYKQTGMFPIFFPYVTPIEHAVANYAVYNNSVVNSRQIFFRIKENTATKDPVFSESQLKSIGFRQDIGLYNFHIVGNIVAGLSKMIRELNSTELRGTDTRNYSLYQYIRDIYSKKYKQILKDGQKKFDYQKYRNYLLLFPGDFIFRLDYILNNFSRLFDSQPRLFSKIKKKRKKKVKKE